MFDKQRKASLALALVPWVVLILGILMLAPAAYSYEGSIDADSARYAALGRHYEEQGLQRGADADSARYAALGRAYGQDATQRGLDADSARYAALGRYYQQARLQRGADADSARYAALGEYYVRLAQAGAAGSSLSGTP